MFGKAKTPIHDMDDLYTCSVPSASSGPIKGSGSINMIELSPTTTVYTNANPNEIMDGPPSDSEFEE